MVNQNLMDYIKKSRLKGTTDIEITAQLQRVGWDYELINDTFKALDNPPESIDTSPIISNDSPEPLTATPEKNESENNKTSILAIISLIFSIIFWPIGLILSIIALVKIKKSKQKGKGFAIASLVISIILLLLTVAGAIFFVYMMNNITGEMEDILAHQDSDLLIARYNDSNGVEHTNIQAVPNSSKPYQNSCYKSVIADPSEVEETNCILDVYGPRVYDLLPMAYFHVHSVSAPGQDAFYGAEYTKETIDEGYQGDETYTGSTIETSTVNGIEGYVLRWGDGVFKYRTYFLDVPAESNYLSDGERIDVITINGMDGDPESDIFTKQLDVFVENFEFI